MPKVSVIIPTYNAIEYLPVAVESVLQQSFTDFELLIIDDGSSDHTAQWTSDLGDPRIKLISQKNQGASAARNKGIALAQAEYIAFLDADDLWEVTKLEKQVRFLEENPTVGVVHTWIYLVDQEGMSTGRVMNSYAEGFIWEELLERNSIACLSVMVRKHCFDRVGVFDCSLSSLEDWDMWIRIARRYPFAVLHEPLAYYRQLPGSKSKNCQVVEKAFDTVIHKAFANVSPELYFLKTRSYGYANIYLAWKAIQTVDRNYKLARHYLARAISYYPQLRFGREYIRISSAITALRLLGSVNYSKFLKLAHTLRRLQVAKS